MEHEYGLAPEAQARYESRQRALNTRIVENKTMIFRRRNDGTVETRVLQEKDVDARYLTDGWVDSASKCESADMYKLALEYPDRRTGQLRRMLREGQRAIDEAIAKAAAASKDAEALQGAENHAVGRIPEIRTEVEDDPREALIAQGAELGLKFDKRMKAETMREKIAEAEGVADASDAS